MSYHVFMQRNGRRGWRASVAEYPDCVVFGRGLEQVQNAVREEVRSRRPRLLAWIPATFCFEVAGKARSQSPAS